MDKNLIPTRVQVVKRHIQDVAAQAYGSGQAFVNNEDFKTALRFCMEIIGYYEELHKEHEQFKLTAGNTEQHHRDIETGAPKTRASRRRKQEDAGTD